MAHRCTLRARTNGVNRGMCARRHTRVGNDRATHTARRSSSVLCAARPSCCERCARSVNTPAITRWCLGGQVLHSTAIARYCPQRHGAGQGPGHAHSRTLTHTHAPAYSHAGTAHAVCVCAPPSHKEQALQRRYAAGRTLRSYRSGRRVQDPGVCLSAMGSPSNKSDRE